MTSIVKVEAISGAIDDGATCYALQVDQVHLLLDCGWDDRFDASYADALRRRAPFIDAVLISYPDVAHMGALPYLVPIYKMGQMFLYDWFLSHNSVEDFNVFTLDDVDAAFDKIEQLKYSQQVSLKGRGHGLSVAPLPAGHMLGGTLWRITKMGEEDIVYAVDFNHKKERHLNACLLDSISRPHLLICGSSTAGVPQARRRERDEQLLTNMVSTLRQGGDALVVIDTAGRVLELAHLLDQLWHNAEAGLAAYSLVMLSHVAYNVVEFAKSQVEWMSDKVLHSFEQGRHVQLCHSQAELSRVRSPRVVLASQPDMECGFSRDLFLEWSADPKNSIILTQRSYGRSLASKLIRMAEADESDHVSRHLALEIKRRIRLEGAELDAYWQRRRAEMELLARQRMEQQAAARRVGGSHRTSLGGLGSPPPGASLLSGGTGHASAAAAGHLSDDSDSDVEPVEANGLAQEYPYDVMFKFELQQKSSFFKQSRRIYPMYPFVEEKVKWDDYGEIIRPEDYTIIEPTAVTFAGGALGLARPSASGDAENNENETEGQNGDSSASEQAPSKCITSVTKLEVLCRLAFIDFEGVSDGESVKKLLAQIKPRQLVLVRGSAQSTGILAHYCRETGIGVPRLFSPSVGDTVDCTMESHIYQVTLTDALVSSLHLQKVRDAELAWVDAKVLVDKRSTQGGDENDSPSDDPHQPMEQSTSSGMFPHVSVEPGPSSGAAESSLPQVESGALPGTPCLDVLPANAIPSHTAVFVNDPKLSDLKTLLRNNGFQDLQLSLPDCIRDIFTVKRHITSTWPDALVDNDTKCLLVPTPI